ncbi:MAG: hypothetical protein H6732_06380 [Alphaproteobacteria bacterium]|nr:hypothetical protein [Alphaproteobacteria bacterium]
MRRGAIATVALTWATTAHAGSGPWVLGQGDEQIFVGAEAQRFTQLAVGDGAYQDSVIAVDDGVMTFGAKLIGTLGLARRFEVEADLSYLYTYANEPGPVCELLGMGACKTTQGLGPISTRVKWLVVDELAGRPLSMSVGLDLRFGQTTAEHRERVTSLGDGTFALEPRVALGRIGTLPKGWWSIYGDVSARFPLPTDPAFTVGGEAAPGIELVSTVENLWTPVPVVSLGPSVSMLYRPQGVDFLETDFTEKDRFTALRIFVLEAGAKLLVRNDTGITGVLSVFHTVYAVNNPQDVLKVSVGVAFRDFARRRTE